MIVKKIIVQILKKLGITQYELAKRVGISDQALRYLVSRDSRAVRVSVLCKLREVSGMSWSEFGKLLDGEFSE